MTSNTVTHRLAMSAIFVAVAGVVGVAAMLSPSEVPASSPSPTMSADMPGMDHGSAEAPGEGDHGDAVEGDHGDAVEAAPDRPLAPVLGTFGGGASAVLLSAGLLRRSDRSRIHAKEAARAARRTQS